MEEKMNTNFEESVLYPLQINGEINQIKEKIEMLENKTEIIKQETREKNLYSVQQCGIK